VIGPVTDSLASGQYRITNCTKAHGHSTLDFLTRPLYRNRAHATSSPQQDGRTPGGSIRTVIVVSTKTIRAMQVCPGCVAHPGHHPAVAGPRCGAPWGFTEAAGCRRCGHHCEARVMPHPPPYLIPGASVYIQSPADVAQYA
jgi:hypothetical protein